MQKYALETIPYDQLRPGNLVSSPGGFRRYVSHEYLADGRVCLHLLCSNDVPFDVIQHASNWPEVAIGFTAEYLLANMFF